VTTVGSTLPKAREPALAKNPEPGRLDQLGRGTAIRPVSSTKQERIAIQQSAFETSSGIHQRNDDMTCSVLFRSGGLAAGGLGRASAAPSVLAAPVNRVGAGGETRRRYGLTTWSIVLTDEVPTKLSSPS
jgi:hypothetical protein